MFFHGKRHQTASNHRINLPQSARKVQLPFSCLFSVYVKITELKPTSFSFTHESVKTGVCTTALP